MLTSEEWTKINIFLVVKSTVYFIRTKVVKQREVFASVASFISILKVTDDVMKFNLTAIVI